MTNQDESKEVIPNNARDNTQKFPQDLTGGKREEKVTAKSARENFQKFQQRLIGNKGEGKPVEKTFYNSLANSTTRSKKGELLITKVRISNIGNWGSRIQSR